MCVCVCVCAREGQALLAELERLKKANAAKVWGATCDRASVARGVG